MSPSSECYVAEFAKERIVCMRRRGQMEVGERTIRRPRTG